MQSSKNLHLNNLYESQRKDLNGVVTLNMVLSVDWASEKYVYQRNV